MWTTRRRDIWLTELAMAACTGLFLSGCSSPKGFSVSDISGGSAECVRTVTEARLTRSVDTCPLSGGAPNPRSPWRLQILSDWQPTPSWWSDPDRSYSQRYCGRPSFVSEMRQISAMTRLSLDRIETMWDFENAHRIQIYGTAHLPAGPVNFLYEKFATAEPEPRKMFQALFRPCADGK